MASDYRIYPGYDAALISLQKFNPQCRSEGVRATRRDFMGNGSYIDQGLYVELSWSLLPKSAYLGILTLCQLDVFGQRSVTVYCRNDLYDYHRYNGQAIRPQPTWRNSFARDVVLLIRDLELIA